MDANNPQPDISGTITLTESKNTTLTRQKLKGLIFSLMPNNKR